MLYRNVCHVFAWDFLIIDVIISETTALNKSAEKQQASNVDITNSSTTRVSDVNVSAVSSTPDSDAGTSMTTRRTRRNAPSMPSLMEIPPVLDDIEEQPIVTSSDEQIPPSGSHEAMVSYEVLTLIFASFRLVASLILFVADWLVRTK